MKWPEVLNACRLTVDEVLNACRLTFDVNINISLVAGV